MNESTTLEMLRQRKPHLADGPRVEHEDDAEKLLRRLRERGPEGITTGELIREGCFGIRPPNRVGDLRNAGHLIETRREGRGVFRFILIRECANPTSKHQAKKRTKQLGDFVAKERATGLPLFDSVVDS
jgi:hypothetical protein